MTSADPLPARSYLYVPGHREELVAKALATADADAVVIDLEDAVPPPARAAARAIVSRVVASVTARPVWVRVNPIDSGLTFEDLEAAARPYLAGVRLAKTESAADAARVGEWLQRSGCPAGVSCLLESARAVEHAAQIAEAHPRVCGIALGEADLGADLGTSSDAGLLYARSRCVAAARAAGRPAPVQSVFTGLGDEEGLRRSCALGRELGFFGRSAIHPRQLPVINAAFTPTGEEVRRARDIVARWEAGGAENAVTTVAGGLVDAPVVASARRTLALAQHLEVRA
jgi:citrate lyase subunit beta/citryl-CoA lyase